MKNFNKSIGKYGEDLTENHLKSLGYKILHRNFTCKIGEIDIIALNENIICFVEVKSRFFTKYGKPLEAIDYKKRNKIIKIAYYYIQKYKLINYFFRFDVSEIYFKKTGKYEFNFIKDAFRI